MTKSFILYEYFQTFHVLESGV